MSGKYVVTYDSNGFVDDTYFEENDVSRDYVFRDDVLEILDNKYELLSKEVDEISKLKSIDSIEHGQWIFELADNGWADHICSECGYTENMDIHVHLDWRYCPMCGARMEGYR